MGRGGAVTRLGPTRRDHIKATTRQGYDLIPRTNNGHIHSMPIGSVELMAQGQIDGMIYEIEDKLQEDVTGRRANLWR